MENWNLPIFFSATAFVLVATPAWTRLLWRLGFVDSPGGRKTHAKKVARGAGPLLLIPFLVAFSVGIISGPGLMLGILWFSILGFLDDYSPLSSRKKLALQFLGSVLLSCGVVGRFEIASLLLVSAVIVAHVNVANFMDGLNGLATMQAVVVSVLTASVASSLQNLQLATISILLASTSLGFLPWNFPKARIFLGDSGSYLLGSIYGVIFVIVWGEGLPFMAVAMFAIPFTDTFVTLIRRFLSRENLFEAHSDHFYQRLSQGRFGLGKALLTVIGSSSLCGIVGLWVSLSAEAQPMVGVLALCVVCAGYLLAPSLEFRGRNQP